MTERELSDAALALIKEYGGTYARIGACCDPPISRQAVHSWFARHVPPPKRHVLALASALGLDPGQIHPLLSEHELHDLNQEALHEIFHPRQEHHLQTQP